MTACFITDLHIDEPGVFPLGIDTRTRFLLTLQHIAKKNYDFLVLGGDLCNKTGNGEIYAWIKAHLDACGLPYYIIAGNHDTSSIMAHAFEQSHRLQGDEVFYKETIQDFTFHFLDTGRGTISEVQYEWFESCLVDSATEEVLVCMHHPPVLSGSKHMEPKYFFQDSLKFEALCHKFQHKRFKIFCGHYHMERTVWKSNMEVFITPSTFVQIDPDFMAFRKGNDLFGYREIYLKDGALTGTNVIYI